MLFPMRIKKYAHGVKRDERAEVSKSSLVCTCGSDIFALRYNGNMSKKLFSQGTIICNDDGYILLEASCALCSKKFVLFDSRIDGYSAQIDGDKTIPTILQKSLHDYTCPKCGGVKQFVCVRVEYAGIDDIEKGLSLDDCFSWIWVDVECTKCKKRVPALIDMETA